jgi:hypothetical protein
MNIVSKMKFILLMGLAAWTVNGHAQGLRFGIQTNPGLTWVSADNNQVSSNGVRFAFDFGLVVDYVFGAEERYAFNSGLNLFVTGAKLKGTITDTSKTILQSEVTARINYLEIPLTIKLRSNEVGYFTFYGQLGLVPAFAIRSRADYSIETNSPNGIVTMEEKNVKFNDVPAYPNDISKVKAFNLGLHTEAGMEYDISENTALVTGIYFNTGFIDMFKDGDDERIVPRSMGVRIGVLF